MRYASATGSDRNELVVGAARAGRTRPWLVVRMVRNGDVVDGFLWVCMNRDTWRGVPGCKIWTDLFWWRKKIGFSVEKYGSKLAVFLCGVLKKLNKANH